APHELLHRRLRRRGEDVPGGIPARGRRGDADDAAPGFPQGLDGRPQQVEAGGGVGGELGGETAGLDGGDVLHGNERPRGVDDRLERGEGGDERGGLLVIGQVESVDRNVAPLFGYQFGRSGCRFAVAAVGEGDVVAVAGEGGADGGPDAAAASGHQGDPVT